MVTDLAIVALILLVQPLVAVLYVYVAFRLLLRFGARTTGSWADDRIEKAQKAAEELARGD